MKHNIEQWELYMFRNTVKISLNDLSLITEAFRRKHFLNSDPKFYGLGTPGRYKSKLFISSFGNDVPRANNWYRLTQEGERIMKAMEQYFKMPKKADKDKVNEMLFSFQI